MIITRIFNIVTFTAYRPYAKSTVPHEARREVKVTGADDIFIHSNMANCARRKSAVIL